MSGVGSCSRDDDESASSGRQTVDHCGHAGVATTAAGAVTSADGRAGDATKRMPETARRDAPTKGVRARVGRVDGTAHEDGGARVRDDKARARFGMVHQAELNRARLRTQKRQRG